MYAVGILAAVLMALVLKRTLLRGATPPFVMELPSYKVPSPRLVLGKMFENGWAFVKRAGTLIFAVSVVVWALAYYPRAESAIEPVLAARHAALESELAALAIDSPKLADVEAELADVENQIEGAYLRDSYLGRVGRWIEPAVKPLGWDWRIGCAAIASFPAREVVVATLGVIYNLGSQEDESSTSLRETLAAATWDGTDRPVFNAPVALSIMVFFALCAQCASTLAIMRRETGSWRWPAFAFLYMTALAYIGALVTYQVGIRLL
jgi:ferrous iron transport protein B